MSRLACASAAAAAVALLACNDPNPAPRFPTPGESDSRHAGDSGTRDARISNPVADAASPGAGGQHADSGTHDAAADDGVPFKCAHEKALRVVPTVMLLLDGSTSMESCFSADADAGAGAACGADPAAQPAPPGTISRWQALLGAVANADGVVARHQDRVAFGSAVFGTQPTCPLPIGVIAPELNNYEAIQQKMPMSPPGLTTPTGVALSQVVDALLDPRVVTDLQVGAQVVVLATDGDPNGCEDVLNGSMAMTDYAPSIEAAMKLQAKHQQLYVIGLGDDAAQAHLQEMANIGADMPQMASPGAKLYQPENPGDLADALEAIIDKAQSCDMVVSGKSVRSGNNACASSVLLNGEELACGEPDGWMPKDARHITLSGKACETLKKDADASVEVFLPCSGVPEQ